MWCKPELLVAICMTNEQEVYQCELANHRSWPKGMWWIVYSQRRNNFSTPCWLYALSLFARIQKSSNFTEQFICFRLGASWDQELMEQEIRTQCKQMDFAYIAKSPANRVSRCIFRYMRLTLTSYPYSTKRWSIGNDNRLLRNWTSCIAKNSKNFDFEEWSIGQHSDLKKHDNSSS